MKTFLLLLSAATLIAMGGPASADDKADVLAAMNEWKAKLATGCAGDPQEIVALYAEDAVLWGTISGTIRDDTAEITDYFVNACEKLPKLTVEFQDPLVRVYGDTAVNTGSYLFTYEKDGAKKQLPARYSLTLAKRDGQWLIIDHHSSAKPSD